MKKSSKAGLVGSFKGARKPLQANPLSYVQDSGSVQTPGDEVTQSQI